MDSERIGEGVGEVAEHPVVETGARLGYAANGLLHLLIALIAVRLSWFSTSESADQSGALETMAGNPFGQVLLWVMVVGFVLLLVWQLTEAARPHGGHDGATSRGAGLAKAVVYASLVYTAGRFAVGGHSDSSRQTVDVTAAVMGAPGGQVLVGLVGLGIVVIGGLHVVKGLGKGFLEDLEEHPGRLAVRAGQYGYTAKGVALVIAGALFVLAALRHRASEATGLDGALRTLLGQPFGPYLLTAIAAGFAAFGFYSLARTRHADV